jgi:hypothetical protein
VHHVRPSEPAPRPSQPCLAPRSTLCCSPSCDRHTANCRLQVLASPPAGAARSSRRALTCMAPRSSRGAVGQELRRRLGRQAASKTLARRRGQRPMPPPGLAACGLAPSALTYGPASANPVRLPQPSGHLTLPRHSQLGTWPINAFCNTILSIGLRPTTSLSCAVDKSIGSVSAGPWAAIVFG